MWKRFDILISDLCEELDREKENSLYWKDKYEQVVKEKEELFQSSVDHNKKMLGNMLSFALRTKEDNEGNLVMSKENRESYPNCD
jgi:hypothetical protein